MSSGPTLQSRQSALLWLLVAAVGWGLNWPIIKVILREWPPFFARGTAGMVAALALALMAVLWGERLSVPLRVAPRLVLAALVNVFTWMGFTTVAMLWLTVSEAALLVYTMPIWAAFLAWPLRGDRPTARNLVALALGVSGLCVLLGGVDLGSGTGKLPGIALTLSAAILFALGTVGWRTPLPLPPLVSVAWQVGLGCLPMVVIGLVYENPAYGALSATGWAGMIYMAGVPMGLCYLAWFAALRGLPSALASMGTLLVPLIGTVSAALLLGEPLGFKEITAMGLTLGGIALALWKPPRHA